MKRPSNKRFLTTDQLLNSCPTGRHKSARVAIARFVKRRSSRFTNVLLQWQGEVWLFITFGYTLKTVNTNTYYIIKIKSGNDRNFSTIDDGRRKSAAVQFQSPTECHIYMKEQFDAGEEYQIVRVVEQFDTIDTFTVDWLFISFGYTLKTMKRPFFNISTQQLIDRRDGYEWEINQRKPLSKIKEKKWLEILLELNSRRTDWHFISFGYTPHNENYQVPSLNILLRKTGNLGNN